MIDIVAVRKNRQRRIQLGISINPQFQRSIDKIDEDTVRVSLSISIDNQDTPVPYIIYISIAGVFHLKQWEDKSVFIRNNATAI